MAAFTFDRVAEVLGRTGHAALSRNETLPGLRDTYRHSGRDVDPLCHAGMLERSVGEVRARVDVRAYAADDLATCGSPAT